ncbi:MAG: hypothetical protein AAB468_02625 [Patescibacteria group bacterium]
MKQKFLALVTIFVPLAAASVALGAWGGQAIFSQGLTAAVTAPVVTSTVGSLNAAYVANLNLRLAALVRQYKTSKNKVALAATVKTVLRDRAATLKLLVKDDPKAFLRLVLNKTQRQELLKSLPLAINYVEAEVLARGTLNVWYADDFAHPENSKYFYELVNPDQPAPRRSISTPPNRLVCVLAPRSRPAVGS